MKKDKINTNRIKISKFVFIFSFLFFATIIMQLVRLSLSKTIDGVNLKQFASNRNTMKQTLYASRGTIFDINGDPLAQTVDSYTVIAYLNPKRSEGSAKPKHVVDKQQTAVSLSPLINMSVESILKLLNKSNLYQVELGPGGKGITEITRENIEKLQLPGIDFIQTYKRYYPSDDFLSYTLGYAVNDNNKITGEMGIEKYYNDYLSGKDGYLEYQKDLKGYKIPNTPEVRKDEEDGMDIYLTIDGNVQMFVERAVKTAYQKYNPEWMLMIVADAKTGKILGTSSSPSFNPNVRDIKSYLNPLVSYTYEPGSTMKTFTYMAAMEKGTYNGSATFKSGNITIGDATIYDWNDKGWGTITYDRGYTMSSNVGVSNMMQSFLTGDDLKKYLKTLGFGSKTDFTLPDEQKGIVNFKYPIEIANAGYGQGITITPIQFIQAFTSISNNGIELKPYIVDRIVNSKTKKIVYQGAKQELGRVASEDTVRRIKDLMHAVVNGTPDTCTGNPYKIDGYDVIGKTGTAQYVNPKTGKYYVGTNDFIRSFAGMFPRDNPQVIIYTVAKKTETGGAQAISTSTTSVINDLAKYLNIFPTSIIQNNTNIINYNMPNLLNKKIADATSTLSKNNSDVVVIGDGDKVINQYPNANTKLNNMDKVFLVTNGVNKKMINITGWSSRNIETFCHLTNLSCEYNGYGYAISQSIAEGAVLDGNSKLIVELKTKVE